MLATDSVIALSDGAKITDEGYLVVNARTARTGIQQYLGAEMGRPDLPVVNVYRDESEVFSKRSLESFSRIPITVGHPQDPVTADNWKDVAAGTTGDEVLRDGEYLKIGLKIKDRAAIDAVRSGARELSVGYSTDIVWGDGVAPDGTPYQARQTGIVANHIAIVSKGRAGAKCRVGDSWPVDDEDKRALGDLQAHHRKGHDMTLQKLTVDGISVEMTDTAVQVVSKALAQRDAALVAVDESKGALAALQAQHAKDLSTKDGEIAALRAQIPDAAKLDELATQRADLIADARKVLGDSFDAKGLDAAGIRRAVVAHELGDAAKDLDDSAIVGAYRVIAAKAPSVDPVRGIVGHARANDSRIPAADHVAAHGDYVKHLQDAWKSPAHTTGAQ